MPTLAQEARSALNGGIEEILIPLQAQHHLERLALEGKRGTYAVVEWLLSALGRWAELERVCGLSITVEGPYVVAHIEMRQPGKQVEQWLREHELGRYQKLPDGGIIFGNSSHISSPLPSMVLSPRSLSQEKFSDIHKPWWDNPELTEAPA